MQNNTRLQNFIPIELQEQIRKIATDDVMSPVYRVDKTGKGEVAFLDTTYEEMLANPYIRRYPLDKIGTYSTSVYDEPSKCENFIASMGKRVREKYPHPVIRCGKTSNGLAIHTTEYDKTYEDKSHIDWWIYEGEKEKTLPDFLRIWKNE